MGAAGEQHGSPALLYLPRGAALALTSYAALPAAFLPFGALG